MRLIDADALMTELSTMYKEPTSTEDFMTIGYDKAIADVVVTAHRQPTVDAVEVVRCRDCEWYKTHYSWDGKERKVCGIEPFEPIRQEEDYCSYGERKER